jgi:hypothetical protein
LELAEITPPGIEKGGFKKLQSIVDQEQLSKRFMEIIEDKSLRYSSNTEPIDLLVYLTDNFANFSEPAKREIQRRLNAMKPIFKNVYFIVPMLGINDGITFHLYPNNEDSSSSGSAGGLVENLKM